MTIEYTIYNGIPLKLNHDILIGAVFFYKFGALRCGTNEYTALCVNPILLTGYKLQVNQIYS